MQVQFIGILYLFPCSTSNLPTLQDGHQYPCRPHFFLQANPKVEGPSPMYGVISPTLARSQKTSTKPLDAMRTGPPPLGCQLFRIVCWAPCGQDASGVIKLPQPEGDFVKWDDLVCWLHWWVFFFFFGGGNFHSYLSRFRNLQNRKKVSKNPAREMQNDQK